MDEEEDGSLPPLFLVIPNIAIQVLNSMTFIIPVSSFRPASKLVSEIFDEMGGQFLSSRRTSVGCRNHTCFLRNSYTMRYVRATVEGGVELGFKARMLKKLYYRPSKVPWNYYRLAAIILRTEIDKVLYPWWCNNQRSERDGTCRIYHCSNQRTESRSKNKKFLKIYRILHTH